MSARRYESAAAVASWARKVQEAVARRDEAMRAMRAEGASLRDIAEVAGTTAPTVNRVVGPISAKIDVLDDPPAALGS